MTRTDKAKAVQVALTSELLLCRLCQKLTPFKPATIGGAAVNCAGCKTCQVCGDTWCFKANTGISGRDKNRQLDYD